jgi:hypothetical protein
MQPPYSQSFSELPALLRGDGLRNLGPRSGGVIAGKSRSYRACSFDGLTFTAEPVSANPQTRISNSRSLPYPEPSDRSRDAALTHGPLSLNRLNATVSRGGHNDRLQLQHEGSRRRGV